ncbi:uncharacterized protein V6R79_011157 [Siganus canaliculatus]
MDGQRSALQLTLGVMQELHCGLTDGSLSSSPNSWTPPSDFWAVGELKLNRGLVGWISVLLLTGGTLLVFIQWRKLVFVQDVEPVGQEKILSRRRSGGFTTALGQTDESEFVMSLERNFVHSSGQVRVCINRDSHRSCHANRMTVSTVCYSPEEFVRGCSARTSSLNSVQRMTRLPLLADAFNSVPRCHKQVQESVVNVKLRHDAMAPADDFTFASYARQINDAVKTGLHEELPLDLTAAVSQSLLTHLTQYHVVTSKFRSQNARELHPVVNVKLRHDAMAPADDFMFASYARQINDAVKFVVPTGTSCLIWCRPAESSLTRLTQYLVKSKFRSQNARELHPVVNVKLRHDAMAAADDFTFASYARQINDAVKYVVPTAFLRLKCHMSSRMVLCYHSAKIFLRRELPQQSRSTHNTSGGAASMFLERLMRPLEDVLSVDLHQPPVFGDRKHDRWGFDCHWQNQTRGDSTGNPLPLCRILD